MGENFNGSIYQCLIRQRAELMGFALCIPELNMERLQWKFPEQLASSENEKFKALAGKEMDIIRFYDDGGNIEINIPFTLEELKTCDDDNESAKILSKVVRTQRKLVNYYLRTRGMEPAKYPHLPSAQKLCLRHLRNAYFSWYSLTNKDKIRDKFYRSDDYMKSMKTIEIMSYLPATEMLYEIMSLPATVPSELLFENVSRFSLCLSQNPQLTQTFCEHRLTRNQTGITTMFLTDTLRRQFEECKYTQGKTPYMQMRIEEGLLDPSAYTESGEDD